jgi:hypothetical protein
LLFRLAAGRGSGLGDCEKGSQDGEEGEGRESTSKIHFLLTSFCLSLKIGTNLTGLSEGGDGNLAKIGRF